MTQINYGKHFVSNDDIQSINKVLRSNLLTQGKTVEEFESSLKKYLGAKYCTVVSSGTAGLYILGKALNWKKGDYIITTPNSFVATSNCIVYSGAIPVFVDIDEDTGNICAKKLELKINEFRKKRKKIKAIIAIDYGGCPSDWPKINSIAKKRRITLINDSCHSLGSSIKKNKSYAIKYADFATFSFHPVKPITTGEGGAIISKDKKIDQRLKLLRAHGIHKNPKKQVWHQDMKLFGYNYRITDFQCALGISQLKNINKYNLKRKKIADIYRQKFKNLEFIKTQVIPKNFKSSYHLFPIKLNFLKLNINKNTFFKKLLKMGVKLQVHYIPIYRHSYYRKKFNLKIKNFPNTEKFYNQVVSLPIYYNLRKKTQLYVINCLKKIFLKD